MCSQVNSDAFSADCDVSFQSLSDKNVKFGENQGRSSNKVNK